MIDVEGGWGSGGGRGLKMMKLSVAAKRFNRKNK